MSAAPQPLLSSINVQMMIVDPRLKEYLQHNPHAVPHYTTPGAAGIDLSACLSETTTLYPHDKLSIGTGISIYIADPSICAMLVPRSSMGKLDITLANTIGIIDSDYQGEIRMLIKNTGDTPYRIKPFERLTQLIFIPIIRAIPITVEQFTVTTQRGTQGFGSTGKN